MNTRRLLACLAALALGCTGNGNDDDAATSPTPAGTPTFAADIIPIFEASCGTADNACHARVAYGANSGTVGGECRGWLSLENAMLGSVFYGGAADGQPTGCPDRSLYDRLTEPGPSNAWECGPNTFLPNNPGPLVPYVLPGDPAGSYLYRKINGGPYCDMDGVPSDPMPPTVALSAVQIDIIRRWIDGGAPQ